MCRKMLICTYSLALLAILAGLPHFNLLRQVTGMRSSCIFYVRPTYLYGCKACFTFSESLDLLMSTTGATFSFLPGNHSVANTTQVAQKDIEWLSLQWGMPKSPHPIWKRHLSFTFKEVGELISDLELWAMDMKHHSRLVVWILAVLTIYGTNSLILKMNYGYGLLALAKYPLRYHYCWPQILP